MLWYFLPRSLTGGQVYVYHVKTGRNDKCFKNILVNLFTYEYRRYKLETAYSTWGVAIAHWLTIFYHIFFPFSIFSRMKPVNERLNKKVNLMCKDYHLDVWLKLEYKRIKKRIKIFEVRFHVQSLNQLTQLMISYWLMADGCWIGTHDLVTFVGWPTYIAVGSKFK